MEDAIREKLTFHNFYYILKKVKHIVEVKMIDGKLKLVTELKELPVDVLEGILNEVVDSTVKQAANVIYKGHSFELNLHKAIGYVSMVINVILIYILMK